MDFRPFFLLGRETILTVRNDFIMLPGTVTVAVVPVGMVTFKINPPEAL